MITIDLNNPAVWVVIFFAASSLFWLGVLAGWQHHKHWHSEEGGALEVILFMLLGVLPLILLAGTLFNCAFTLLNHQP